METAQTHTGRNTENRRPGGRAAAADVGHDAASRYLLNRITRAAPGNGSQGRFLCCRGSARPGPRTPGRGPPGAPGIQKTGDQYPGFSMSFSVRPSAPVCGPFLSPGINTPGRQKSGPDRRPGAQDITICYLSPPGLQKNPGGRLPFSAILRISPIFGLFFVALSLCKTSCKILKVV